LITNKLKINLFGESWKFKQILIPENLFEQFNGIANRLNQPLATAISDPFFYHYLNNKNFQTINDLPGQVVEGLLDTRKNHLEIWFKRKKIKKITIYELRNNQLLFPLYNTKVEKTELRKKTGIYFEQKGIGMLGSFEIIDINFNIDDLEFHLKEIGEITLLESLAYKSLPLNSVKQDTIITYQNSFEIE
jgi:hypothetical protein